MITLDETQGEVYKWLFPDKDDEVEPVEVMTTVRNSFENLPDLKVSFKKKELLDGTDMHANYIVPEMLKWLGAWKMPDRFPNGAANTWVNPKHDGASRYTDGIIQCKCGSWVGSMNDTVRHEESCLLPDKYRAKADLAQVRMDIVKDASYYNIDRNLIFNRLDISSSTMTEFLQMADIDIGRLRDRARDIRANTMKYLLYEYEPHIVADVFGIHRATVRREIRSRTTSKPENLEKIRNHRRKL